MRYKHILFGGTSPSPDEAEHKSDRAQLKAHLALKARWHHWRTTQIALASLLRNNQTIDKPNCFCHRDREQERHIPLTRNSYENNSLFQSSKSPGKQDIFVELRMKFVIARKLLFRNNCSEVIILCQRERNFHIKLLKMRSMSQQSCPSLSEIQVSNRKSLGHWPVDPCLCPRDTWPVSRGFLLSSCAFLLSFLNRDRERTETGKNGLLTTQSTGRSKHNHNHF